MIKPDQIQSLLASPAKGLYESFYFRGNHVNGQQAFWLKHNFLIFKNSPDIQIESIVVLYDQSSQRVETFKKVEEISLTEFHQRYQHKDWHQFEWHFKSQESLQVTSHLLQGKVEQSQWNLSLKLSGETYWHFSKDWFYHAFFPKKKILTKDIKVHFTGSIQINDFKLAGDFVGMNGHNWGTEHAYLYAYANCNQFENEDAYFDGFSAKIKLAGLTSPYLSGCSLKIKDQWFHFNDVTTSFCPRVTILSDNVWEVEFTSSDYLLKVRVDGSQQLWGELHYDHPSHKTSLVKNTKFASGEWELTFKKEQNKKIFLHSHFVELETLFLS